MIFELDEAPRNRALMRVIGVGGAGGNAVNRMIDEKLEGVEFISANTDGQALAASKAPTTIQLGKRLTQGLGAGARPGIGRQAIAEDADEVRATIEGADLVFIAAGMGGGTGTGAAPVIGEMARELGALVIAVVTRPFRFEGKKRLRQAEQGLEELARTVDTMIVVPNEHLLSVVGKGTSFRNALKKADEVLLQATQGISDLIRVSGEVNVDFADVRTIMSSCGAALMGTGVGRGENRALEAARDAVTSPLLDNVSIRGAQGVLINITGGSDLTIDEVTGISTMIQDEVGDEAEIIFGAVHDSSMEGELRVTLIATGFEESQELAVQEQAAIQPRFGAARQQQAGLRAVGGGRVDAVQPPAIVRREPMGGGRQRVSGATTQRSFYGSNMEGNRAATGSRMGMDAIRSSRPTGGSVARPSLGGGYRSHSDVVDPRELELPTFIRRIEA